MNAMALIAPGAFLWITYQLQAAATAPDGTSVASDIWAGIGFALDSSLLNGISYAQLARLYPEAGFGSCYYFAEKAFLDRENREHHKWARLAKIVTGWAAHLFYWVYPGVMVAFMATLIGYIYTQLTGKSISIFGLSVIAIVFALLTGYIAMRGRMRIDDDFHRHQYRPAHHPGRFQRACNLLQASVPASAVKWTFKSASDVIMPHSFVGVMIQSTIAILILVGFESCTAFAAETKNPKKEHSKSGSAFSHYSRFVRLPVRVFCSRLHDQRQACGKECRRRGNHGHGCRGCFKRSDWRYGDPRGQHDSSRHRVRTDDHDRRHGGNGNSGDYAELLEHSRPDQLCNVER